MNGVHNACPVSALCNDFHQAYQKTMLELTRKVKKTWLKGSSTKYVVWCGIILFGLRLCAPQIIHSDFFVDPRLVWMACVPNFYPLTKCFVDLLLSPFLLNVRAHTPTGTAAYIFTYCLTYKIDIEFHDCLNNYCFFIFTVAVSSRPLIYFDTIVRWLNTYIIVLLLSTK